MSYRPTNSTAKIELADGFQGTSSSLTRLLLASLVFALAAMAAAHMRFWLPFTPVPVTMQTFVVLLAGLCLGGAGGGLSQLKYLTLGAIGLPAFSGGLAALVGPSGGYLLGFVAAAVVAGKIYSTHRSTAGAIAACVAGISLIYLLGALWLWAITGASPTQVLTLGVLPFVPGDALKVAAVVLLMRGPFTGAFMARVFRHG